MPWKPSYMGFSATWGLSEPQKFRSGPCASQPHDLAEQMSPLWMSVLLIGRMGQQFLPYRVKQELEEIEEARSLPRAVSGVHRAWDWEAVVTKGSCGAGWGASSRLGPVSP